jgi:hypothetical protein
MNPLALMIGCDKAASHARSALPGAPVLPAAERRTARARRIVTLRRRSVSTLGAWTTASRRTTTRGAALR